MAEGPAQAAPVDGRTDGRTGGRRWARRVALGALALLPPLALAGLWYGPRLTDWNEHRDRLAILAAGRLGQRVTLAGPVRLTLLPQPMLEAGGVTIGGAEDEISVRARALRLRLDLPALLRLRLEPREITIVGAEVRLPWPPVPAGGQPFRPPPWLTGLQGRIQDSRVTIGQVALERVEADLAAATASEALRIQGRFRWRQTDVEFDTTLGRAGWDGIAPLALTLTGARASASASGVLLPEGGFEGTLQGGGADLSALLPAPAGSFRLRGRLSASADLLTADELALDLAGSPARGAATLRLAPAPRLDVALVTGRVELDPWLAALRGAGALPLPFSLDLSAEAAAFRGVTLRRLRGAAFLEGERLAFTDVGAVLPGDTEVELSGTTTARAGGGAGAGAGSGGRLEAAIRFQGGALRATLQALGLPVEGTDPTRLRSGEGRFRLVLDDAQAAIPEFTATLDGGRVSGAGVWRFGARPALGLGLTLERLPLDGWVAPGTLSGLGWAGWQQRLAGFDANLRLAAEQASWDGLAIQGLSADASLENGRLTARRLSGRVAESDVALSGVLQFGAQPRLSDVALEVGAAAAGPLLALLPGPWPDRMPVAAAPLALRLSGSGPVNAVALRGGLDLGDLRAEANGALDLTAPRYTGTLTLRHPGAPRLLAEGFGWVPPPWLGEGSLSLIAGLALGPQDWTAESFDLVAAGLRLGGQVTLSRPQGVPRLTGRLAAERLPLPWIDLASREPLALDALAGWEAELALSAQAVEPAGLPALAQAAATLRLRERVLALENLQFQLMGGRLNGAVRLEAGASPPVLAVQGRLAGLSLGLPLSGLPVDLTAGRIDAEAELRAAGFSPAALLATLEGSGRVAVRDGVLSGTDLRAAQAASERDGLATAEAGLRAALAEGATAFEAAELGLKLEGGRAVLENGRMALPEAPGARLSGEVDLARGGMDLLLATRDGDAPAFGLRLTGPLGAPRRVPELADWLRWRAAR
ncbi:AsmA family protein [Roseomonas sp. GC11]|uniref:AsmA family protein n=1 Tax=Roseomonas sp. GC11 TaxID=2950546 RepID=UPI00210CE905|nr:AsmA family protein [Roseomonas sp. GC11]MCQ4162506.1 AsmA family protein [Roseomonas sp. GC11]